MRKVLMGLLAVAAVLGVVLAFDSQPAYAQGPGRGPWGAGEPPCGYAGGMWGWGGRGMMGWDLSEIPEECQAYMNQYGPFGPGGWGGFGLSPVAIAAEALGMEQADLVAELRDGKTIAQVAEEQGVELQTVVDAIVDAHAERLAQAVEAGLLTQEEADERLSQLAEDMAERLSEPFTFQGWGGGPGFMGRRAPMGRGGPWGR